MLIHRICNSIFNSCSYVILVNNTDYWVIDCGDLDLLLQMLEGHSLKGILITHSHFDHIYGLNDLLRIYPDTLVYTNLVGKMTLLSDKKNLSLYHGTPFVFQYPDNVRIIKNGDLIRLAMNLNAEVFSTPGHHPSCLSYIIGDSIFTGDSYIPGAKVVTNLPNANKLEAASSLKLIKKLGVNHTIYPGHFK